MYIIFYISCRNNRIYQQEYRGILELIMEGADTLADIQRKASKISSVVDQAAGRYNSGDQKVTGLF